MAKFQMNLVDWFKGMVANRRGEELLDPLMETHPSPRALKRVLLVCLRCIDSDANKRPKMGQIVHMLESEEFSYRAVSFPPLFSCTNQVAFFFFSPYSKKEKFNQAIQKVILYSYFQEPRSTHETTSLPPHPVGRTRVGMPTQGSGTRR